MKIGASLAIIAILTLTSGCTEGRHLLQGSNNTANSVVVRWLVPSNGILDAVRVPVNGSVTFSWTGLHDVWQIPTAQCPGTFRNGSGITQIARSITGGSATVVFPEEKVYFFACSVSDHCREGQLIAIRVGNARAGAPSPGPARAVGGYSGNSSPGYAGGSSSNYGSSNSSSSGSGYSGNSDPGYGGGSSSNYGSSGGSGYSGNSSPGYAGGSSSNYGSSGSG